MPGFQGKSDTEPPTLAKSGCCAAGARNDHGATVTDWMILELARPA
jgi:hypothetical protein